MRSVLVGCWRACSPSIKSWASTRTGLFKPSRHDASPQRMDSLREAIAEYISGPHNGRVSGNGKAHGIPT
jgi:hypothetical protein